MGVMRAMNRMRRHGIEAARVPWVATADAPQCKPSAAQHSEAADRFERVLRTGRVEAARRPEERTQRALIQPDQQCCGEAHCSVTRVHNASRLARSAALAAPRTPARALTTRSIGGSPRWR